MSKEDPAPLRADLKLLVIRKLRLLGVTAGSITDAQPLMGGPLGLDSIDILELVLAVEERYGVKIGDQELGQKAFGSIAALADFIIEGRAARGPGGPPTA
jgi:acyl carrier protein